jgi:hypothetical protein
MSGAFALIDIAWFAAGGALVWYGKDRLVQYWKGAEKFAQDMKAKAAALEAKANAVKVAVSK